MASLIEWKVPPGVQPRTGDYAYDLERALSAVVGLHSIIPPDAFTAETLGVERAGNGVLIGDGLVLTVGYLITEAETIWLHLSDGTVVQGHALGFDGETGFGLVQLLGRTSLPVLEFGSSNGAVIGENSLVGAGALVTEGKSFPPGSLIVGAPARAVRTLPEDAIARLRLSAEHYDARQRAYKRGLRRID